jgi:hypothetical protein
VNSPMDGTLAGSNADIKAHAERLQAARERMHARCIDLVVHVSPPTHRLILEIIDAKVSLALLERGGGQ